MHLYIQRKQNQRGKRWGHEAGMSLLELIIASSILVILASAAIPVAQRMVVAPKEAELRRALREMRNAIDHYKDVADKNLVRVQVGSEGYPPDLETLVKGVEYGSSGTEKVRFLRRIPIDPMTGRAEWRLQAVQDDPEDRKSTRLNSSHLGISYAVFCLKK